MDSRQVRFEDVVGPGRKEVLAEVGEWVGTGTSLAAATAEEMPPVMATAPPRRRRWEARSEELAMVLASDGVAETAARLGYDDPADWT